MKTYTGLFILLFLLPSFLFAQKKKDDQKQAMIANWVTQKQFRFDATYILPQGFSQREIGGQGYFITVSPAAVVSSLPYIGKATSASYIAKDTDMDFTSNQYTYEAKDQKKGRKGITIAPKDVQDVQKISITAYPNGDADVVIYSVSRTTVSYRGILTEFKN